MNSVPILLTAVFLSGATEHDESRRYVRASGDKYTLETEILKSKSDADQYISVTYRPGVQMRLSISFDEEQQIVAAKITQTTKHRKASVRAVFDDKCVVITQGGKLVKKMEVQSVPVLATTAPDWSDIMLLLKRYDQKKGGKQEFSGLWFHPSKEAKILSFTVEKIGKNVIEAKGKKIELGRYRVVLRSGGYVVWADRNGLVYKLTPAKNAKRAVILKGFEMATRNLLP